jgi:hypothetical protein
MLHAVLALECRYVTTPCCLTYTCTSFMLTELHVRLSQRHHSLSEAGLCDVLELHAVAGVHGECSAYDLPAHETDGTLSC